MNSTTQKKTCSHSGSSQQRGGVNPWPVSGGVGVGEGADGGSAVGVAFRPASGLEEGYAGLDRRAGPVAEHHGPLCMVLLAPQQSSLGFAFFAVVR